MLQATLATQPVLLAWLEKRQSWPTLAEFEALTRETGVRTASGLELRFVPAPRRRRRRGSSRRLPSPNYEHRIYEHGEIQTRIHNWHDFFNAMAWVLFPQTKAALNARQVLGGVPGVVRTREQDRLAMMDEGGVVMAQGQVLMLGHALMESMVYGKQDIRAMAFSVTAECQNADESVAAAILNGIFNTPISFPLFDLDRGLVHAGRSGLDQESVSGSIRITGMQ